LEHDPWEPDTHSGRDMRDAIDELLDSADPLARTTGTKLRQRVRAKVLDWRGALDRGTVANDRRLRCLALDRAAADDDVALLERLVTQGCDPTEEVRKGLTPIDVALVHGSFLSPGGCSTGGFPSTTRCGSARTPSTSSWRGSCPIGVRRSIRWRPC